ncbi:MAG: class B sortase [Oscillospiraceae bacterium]
MDNTPIGPKGGRPDTEAPQAPAPVALESDSPAGTGQAGRLPAPERGFDPDVPPDENAPGPPPSDGKDLRRRLARNIILGVLMAVCAVVLGISLANIIQIQSGYQQAINEYDRLQSAYAPTARPAADSQPDASEPMRELWEINPDYVGWIEIPDTVLSYPVVRGADNDKYLNRTFEGVQNAAGTIFMDYRNDDALSSAHTVIYGHNLKNGRMFGGLHHYLDATYLQNNPLITITTRTATHTYRVFAARVTDMYDPGYRLDFSGEDDIAAFIASYGGPAGATRLLTLSTCTNGEQEERMLVLATLESTAPVAG